MKIPKGDRTMGDQTVDQILARFARRQAELARQFDAWIADRPAPRAREAMAGVFVVGRVTETAEFIAHIEEEKRT
jgi:hypothetical protein